MTPISQVVGWTMTLGIYFLGLGPAQAEPAPARITNAIDCASLITVHVDGSVTRAIHSEEGAPAEHPGTIRYHFGLPAKPPAQRWLEQDSLPICHTRWEEEGIQYTQSVLLTRLGDGDLEAKGKLAADSVLLVQLVGENKASEYTDAKAALGLDRGEQRLRLVLNEDLIVQVGAVEKALLGVIEIPAGGVAEAEGTRLQFRGNMPPGTSGAMTLRFPLTPWGDEKSLDRLRFLDFTEELRRVRQYWLARLKETNAPIFPVGFCASETSAVRPPAPKPKLFNSR